MDEKGRPVSRNSSRPIIESKTNNESASGATKYDKNLTTKIFSFLASATPGTLGAVGAGFAALTYFVVGQLGLLLMGAFGGVILFIQWEQRNAEVARAVRGETGYDVLDRLLKTKSEGMQAAMVSERDIDEEERALSLRFDRFGPETRAALNELVEAILQNYVKWWYTPIVPSDMFFPLACQRVLTSFLVTISSHLGRRRPADALLDFLTNSSSILIVFLSELSRALIDSPSDSKLSAPDAIFSYLSANPNSCLANLLNRKQQAGKFRMVSEDVLIFLDRPTYNCEPANVFLREILANVILEMTLQSCSKPEWINAWIVYLLEAGEPEINQAIDVGMQTRSNADSNRFADIDGNVGSSGIGKGNRSLIETGKESRKQSTVHKKKLSKADEEMEVAMEEMKRMNQMIADAEAQRAKSLAHDHTKVAASDSRETVGADEERLADALKRNAVESKIVWRMSGQNLPIKNGLGIQSSASSVKKSSQGSIDEGAPNKDEARPTPVTSQIGAECRGLALAHKRELEAQLTNFDDPTAPPGRESDGGSDEFRKPVTLQNAIITILDEPGDKIRIKNKPNWDYLVQIEPATDACPGWMIVRKYSDFERLHEVLRRIAAISGADAFTEQHSALPAWKAHTRLSLRGELERYVRDACWHQPLAESEAMKRFFEKDTASTPNHPKSGLQVFEKIGKNVFEVLSSAPTEGSKAVVGGVTGVLENIGLGSQKKPAAPASVPQSSSLQDVTAASRLSMSAPPRLDLVNGVRKARDSLDSQRSSVFSAQPGAIPPMDCRANRNSPGEMDFKEHYSMRNDRNSRDHSRASSRALFNSPSSRSLEGIKLPPPPNAVSDDFEYSRSTRGSPTHTRDHASFDGQSPSLSTRLNTMPSFGSKTSGVPTSGTSIAKQFAQLTEQETRLAVELLFTVINELYTLSSAWNIRRTLLAAAKSFLFRPGNPSLVSIQSLIQTSFIEANTSDGAIAAHVRKLRENAMPTAEERAAWPMETSVEDKEKLRAKARKMLIESGMPAALSGVMGQTATSEALGRVFDCLQVEEVARGLMFGILLQAVRTITH